MRTSIISNRREVIPHALGPAARRDVDVRALGLELRQHFHACRYRAAEEVPARIALVPERETELVLRRIPGADHLAGSAGLAPNGKGRTAVSSGPARSEAAAAAACRRRAAGVLEAPGAEAALKTLS